MNERLLPGAKVLDSHAFLSFHQSGRISFPLEEGEGVSASLRKRQKHPSKLSAFPEGLNSFQEESDESPLEAFQGRHAPRSTTKMSHFPKITADRNWICFKACY